MGKQIIGLASVRGELDKIANVARCAGVGRRTVESSRALG
jgi:hypothetical protein